MKIFGYIVAALLVLGIGGAVIFGGDSNAETSARATVENNGRYITLEQYESNPGAYDDRRLVYFFHAKWCSTCRALEKSIESNIGDIPVDVSIIKADFDEDDALKQEFSVRSQHTLVQVRDDRTIAGKWVAQPNLQTVLAALQEI